MTAIETAALQLGQVVWVRSACLRKSAIGEIQAIGLGLVHVCLFTDYYDWDGPADEQGKIPQTAGAVLPLSPSAIEEMQWG